MPTVLVIACPHALGLAIPLVVSIATERAARGGVLIKDRLALESMRTVNAVLFDKTGTLTKGEPTVTGIHPVGDHTEDDVLALAAAAETDSEHPLVSAIVGAARTRALDVPGATEFSSSPAVGVKATVAGRVIEVGGPYLLDRYGQAEVAIAKQWRDEGAIILHVLADGQVIGALRLADEIRPESRDTVDALHAHGVQVVMITGDAQAVANTVAHELGIDRVFAGVRPEDKAAKVAELQAEGRKVAMVGDGAHVGGGILWPESLYLSSATSKSYFFEESLWTRCSPQTNAYLSVPLRRIRLRLTPVHLYYFWGVVKDGRRDGDQSQVSDEFGCGTGGPQTARWGRAPIDGCHRFLYL